MVARLSARWEGADDDVVPLHKRERSHQLTKSTTYAITDDGSSGRPADRVPDAGAVELVRAHPQGEQAMADRPALTHQRLEVTTAAEAFAAALRACGRCPLGVGSPCGAGFGALLAHGGRS